MELAKRNQPDGESVRFPRLYGVAATSAFNLNGNSAPSVGGE